jgi:membrane dipeptidase
MARPQQIIWDNHGCMPLRSGGTQHLPELGRYRAAGVNVVGLNVGFGPQALDEHVRVLARFRQWLKVHSDEYRIVGSVADIEAAAQDGKLGVFFDVEGTGPLDEGDAGLIELFYDLGVRWMSIAYNRQTKSGYGCYDAEDGGLTQFGRRVLAEMRRVGMVTCCSHTGERTTLDVFEAADAPVILSHSNAKAVWEHTRNVTDRIIKGCAATGGVIGINGFGIFLGNNDNSTDAVVRHIDYIAQLVGPDHVGLGLDYVFDVQEMQDFFVQQRHAYPDDPSYRCEPRFVEPERIPQIAARLRKLGYEDAELNGILGGNWLRIAQAVWK